MPKSAPQEKKAASPMPKYDPQEKRAASPLPKDYAQPMQEASNMKTGADKKAASPLPNSGSDYKRAASPLPNSGSDDKRAASPLPTSGVVPPATAATPAIGFQYAVFRRRREKGMRSDNRNNYIYHPNRHARQMRLVRKQEGRPNRSPS